jgi:hypothetical protein
MTTSIEAQRLIYCYLHELKNGNLKWPEATNAGHALCRTVMELYMAKYDSPTDQHEHDCLVRSEAYKHYEQYRRASYCPDPNKEKTFLALLELPHIDKPEEGVVQLLQKYDDLEKQQRGLA